MLRTTFLALLGSLGLALLVNSQAASEPDQPGACPVFNQTGIQTFDSPKLKVYDPALKDVPNDSTVPVSYQNHETYFYVDPGVGACGDVYRNSSMVACVSPGYFPAGDNLAAGTPCDKWIEVQNQGKTVQVRATDKCLGATCNEVWLSKQAFGILGGPEAFAAGRLQGEVRWRFLKDEPWWACAAGLPGRAIDGNKDSCDGTDDYDCPRSGRLLGDERIVGPKVYDLCKPYGQKYDPPF